MGVQQVPPLLIHPFFFGKGLAFGTMPVPAGVIGDPGKAALVTGFYVSAQRGSPAIHDGPGRFPLHWRHGIRRGIGIKISGEYQTTFDF